MEPGTSLELALLGTPLVGLPAAMAVGLVFGDSAGGTTCLGVLLATLALLLFGPRFERGER